MKQPYRVFVAHAKSMSESDIETTCAAVKRLLTEKNVNLEIVVTSARDDYTARALQCGGWDRWCESIFDVIDVFTREPRFHAVVVPRTAGGEDRSVVVGRATAAICKVATMTEHPVLVFEPSTETICPAQGAQTLDAENWQAGWRILY
jgi:hypothetical protein